MEDSGIDVQDEHVIRRNNEIEMASVGDLLPHHRLPSQFQQPPESQQPPAEVSIQLDDDNGRSKFEASCKFIRAVLAGNEEDAVAIFKTHAKEIVETRIGQDGESAFHMAIVAAKEKHVAAVVEAILGLPELDSKFLAIGNTYETHSLHYAAISGNLKITKVIYEMDNELAKKENQRKMKPIYLAALAGHSDVINFFIRKKLTDDDRHGSLVLNACISGGLFGLAMELVNNNESSAITKDGEGEDAETALEVLARTPSPAAHKDCSTIWRKIIKPKGWISVEDLLDKIWKILIKRKPDIYKTSCPEKLLLSAAENGNDEFLVYLLDRYPGLVYSTNALNHTIFHIAILNRHEKIFTLIYEIGSLKDYLATSEDVDDNSMLHLAAKLSPPDQLNRVHGAALQMQRELLWYKEVEKIVPPAYVKLKNKNEKTPHEIFIDEHLDLMKAGENWMKRTTQFSMVVSTLIATVVFTTAFTIPGGLKDNDGTPNFIRNKLFDIFETSEIIAMLCSCISIVMYLCILTSHYTEKDFLKYLPLWLSIGTTSLFFSLTSMLVAFCSAFLVFKRHDKHYVNVLLACLALVPVMFIPFNYSLLVDILKTTFSSKSLSRSSKKLFPRNTGVPANSWKHALQRPFRASSDICPQGRSHMGAYG